MKKKYSKPVTDVFVMNCEGMMRECSWKASDESSSVKIINGQATDSEHSGWKHHEGGPDVFGSSAKRSSLWDE